MIAMMDLARKSHRTLQLPYVVLLLTLSGHLLHAYDLSESDTISLDKGNNYRWGWITNIAVGSFGAVYNALSLWMMLSLDESHQVQFYWLNVCINLSDLIYALERLVYAIVYINNGGLYGGVSCEIEAISSLFSICFTMYCIAGMSLVSRYDICNHRKFTVHQMNIYIIGSILISIVLCIIAYFVPSPYGGYKPDFSGLFCFIDWSAPITTPILYTFIVFIPLGYVSYNVYITYYTVKQAQDILRSHGIKERAKGQYIQMVFKLIYFVAVTLFFYTPSVVSSAYQIITRKNFSGVVCAFVEFMGNALPCLATPTLFYYLNPDLREMFWVKLGRYLIVFVPLQYRKKTVKLFNDVSNISSSISHYSSKIIDPNHVSTRFQRVHPIRVSVDMTSINLVDYDDVEIWLSDASLRAVFEEHCRSEYVIENVLFVDYARTYETISKGISLSLEGDLEKIELAWKDLENQAKKMFELFIQPQIAPFEINIDYEVRDRIVGILVPVAGAEIKFPPLKDASAKCVIEHVQLFEKSLQCVLDIIRSDIWPRFRKSSRFHKAKRLHVTNSKSIV